MSIKEVKNSDTSFKQYPNFENTTRSWRKHWRNKEYKPEKIIWQQQCTSWVFQRAILAKKDIRTGMGTQHRHCFKWMSWKDVSGHKHHPNFTRAGWNTQSSLLQCFGSKSIKKIPSKSQQHYGGTSATRQEQKGICQTPRRGRQSICLKACEILHFVRNALTISTIVFANSGKF